MSFGVLIVTFALVIPAELPDKTFISCIVMASRHRPLPVWLGGASALTLQAGIAVVAGRLLELLPQTAVRSVVAALFLLGALYLLLVPEKSQEAKGERLGEEGERAAAQGGGESGTMGEPATGDPSPAAPQVGWRIALTTFTIVALAEFGDITQILIANLTAHYRQPVSVFIGAVCAFAVVSGAGVLGGRALIRVIPLSIVRRLSGAALLGLGIYTIVELL